MANEFQTPPVRKWIVPVVEQEDGTVKRVNASPLDMGRDSEDRLLRAMIEMHNIRVRKMNTYFALLLDVIVDGTSKNS